MEDNIIGNQIMLLRKKFGLTQEDLAIKLGYSKQTVSNWETGLKTPRMGAIQKISDLFNVPKSFIIEGEHPSSTLTLINDTTAKLEEPRQKVVLNVAIKELQQQQHQHQHQQLTSLEEYRKRKSEEQVMGKIDWLGCASAGTGEFLTESVNEEIELPINIIPAGADFCLSVNGNSMEPIFHNDDYIFIEKQVELFSGAIGVFIINGEAFLKRVWFENNNARLESFNKGYEDIIVSEEDDFIIVGKVVM